MMNKQDIVKNVAATLEATQKDAAKYVDAVFTTIKDAMVDGESVNIAGFGKFEVVEKDECQRRNPQTGESIMVAAHKAPKFKAATALKEAVR